VCVAPLEGRNAGWIINALEIAFEQHGAPKHIISDQAGVFTGGVFAELLRRWNVKPRLGAIGKHGAIAVTERVIKTLKYEWLEHAAIIKGFDHLVLLCAEFETWHNNWRPHMTLNGLRPDDSGKHGLHGTASRAQRSLIPRISWRRGTDTACPHVACGLSACFFRLEAHGCDHLLSAHLSHMPCFQ
jgi:transposase InsO family protein